MTTPVRPARKCRILFLAANPSTNDPDALGKEAKAIQEEFERAGHRERFEFMTRWAVRGLDLLRELRKLKPSVVHFCDASASATSSSDRSRPCGVFFNGSNGGAKLVSAEALKHTFGAAGKSVQLIVLSACYTTPQAELLLAHVDCVVGMSSAISREAARLFAIGFYGGLGECETVADAFNQGVAAIQLMESTDNFGVQYETMSNTLPALLTRPGIDANSLYVVKLAAPRRCTLIIRATLSDLDVETIRRLRDELRNLSGDISLEITELQEGSVKMSVSLSSQAAARLNALRERGLLERLCGFDVAILRVHEGSDVPPENGGDAGADDIEGYNLREVDLCGADLSGEDLVEEDLSGANLRDTNLAGANFTRANLTRANLARANLTRANLTRANLTGADLAGANLAGATLTGAKLTGGKLAGAKLIGAHLAGADLAGTNLTEANLVGTDLAPTSLAGANLAGTFEADDDLRWPVAVGYSRLLVLDRVIHREVLDDMLAQQLRSQVLLVHGEVDQGHDHFAQIIALRLRSAASRWREITVAWPAPSASLSVRLCTLLEQLACGLEVRLTPPAADPSTPDGADAWASALALIAAALDASAESLLVRHVLHCLRTGPAGDDALVDAYLRKIWVGTVARPGSHVLVVFDARRTEQRGFPLTRSWRVARQERAATRAIEAVFDRHHRAHGNWCRALPELTSVSARDLVDWLHAEYGLAENAARAEARLIMSVSRGGRFDLVVQRLIASARIPPLFVGRLALGYPGEGSESELAEGDQSDRNRGKQLVRPKP